MYGYIKKKKVKVFMINRLVKISQQEMNILWATFLTKYSKGIDGNFCFTPYLIQIITNVVTVDCEPNTHNELRYKSIQKFLQFRPENKSAKWNPLMSS
jgi:hypothetical protein